MILTSRRYRVKFCKFVFILLPIMMFYLIVSNQQISTLSSTTEKIMAKISPLEPDEVQKTERLSNNSLSTELSTRKELNSKSQPLKSIELNPQVTLKKNLEKRESKVVRSAAKNVAAVLDPPKEGPGEMGKPVKIKNPDKETKNLISVGWYKNAYNQYVSDIISVQRELPDVRDPWCKAPGRLLPVSSLPSTDVIVCFHNEAWSVLLRTVHSVLARSPESLVNSIILVDDASTEEHLKHDLEAYMAQFEKVRILRSVKRVGLIRARLIGLESSHAPVVTYLDSHCEATAGWLEPLLDRIARNSSTVVCPVIDVISDTTLEYLHSRVPNQVGGFSWQLHFNWHVIPKRERRRQKHMMEPVHSPTMAGGLFSIDRKFFQRLGTYDPEFDIWGGENLELSFKTWMCGGTLEVVLCSHVGHIFRKRSPYKWRTGVDVLKKNSVRLAEVWMDEYKELYYDKIGHRLGDFGDVSSRKKLRQDLKCKSFQWYLDNVFPEQFIPSKAVAFGQVKNDWANICLDSGVPKLNGKSKPIYICHGNGGNQYFSLSKNGEVRSGENCLDHMGASVLLQQCHGQEGNQLWVYSHKEGRLRLGDNGKCLTIANTKDKLTVENCRDGEVKQRWTFEKLQHAH